MEFHPSIEEEITRQLQELRAGANANLARIHAIAYEELPGDLMDVFTATTIEELHHKLRTLALSIEVVQTSEELRGLIMQGPCDCCETENLERH